MTSWTELSNDFSFAILVEIFLFNLSIVLTLVPHKIFPSKHSKRKSILVVFLTVLCLLTLVFWSAHLGILYQSRSGLQ